MAERQRGDDDLLTIHQAAALLQVSPTSLRRWTQSGQLKCERVGGRRERRFRRADLMRCLEAPDTPPQTFTAAERAAEVTLASLVIPWGSHLCDVYATDQGRLRLGVPFLAQGLARGEPCFLVAEPEVATLLLAEVCRVEPRAAAAVSAGRLIIRPGCAQPLDMLDIFFTAFSEQGLRNAAGIRVLGDMASFLDQGATPEALMAFEQRYDAELAGAFPVVSLCQYDARRFSGVSVLHACKGHGDVLKFPMRSLLGF